MNPDDVGRAVDALIAATPARPAETAVMIKRARSRVARRRLSVSAAVVVVIAVAVGVTAISRSHPAARVAASTRRPSPAKRELQPAPDVDVTSAPSGVDITAASAREAWKCLDPLQRTDDGGRTWQVVPDPPGTDAAPNRAQFCAAVPGRAWAVRFGTDGVARLLRVGPGTAANARPLTGLATTSATSIRSITFLDADHGWITTEGASFYGPANGPLYRTRDGGITWQLVARNAPVGPSVQFTSATRGWALSSPIGLMTTTDGGATWHRVELPDAPERSFLAEVAARGAAVIVLRNTVIHGVTVAQFDASTDNGRTWTRRSGPQGADLTGASPLGLAVTDATHWHLLAGRLWNTGDGGRTWVSRPEPAVAAVDAMSFPTADVGWLSGSPGASASPVVLRTADAGSTWVDLTSARPVATPSIAGGVIGCPTRALTPAPPGDPRPDLAAAAMHALAAGSFWTTGTIAAIYPLGRQDAGQFRDVINASVGSCGPGVAAASWVVELHQPSGTPLSAVVLAHAADGWHAFGSYA